MLPRRCPTCERFYVTDDNKCYKCSKIPEECDCRKDVELDNGLAQGRENK